MEVRGKNFLVHCKDLPLLIDQKEFIESEIFSSLLEVMAFVWTVI